MLRANALPQSPPAFAIRLIAFLLMRVNPGNVCAAVQASLPICTAAARNFFATSASPAHGILAMCPDTSAFLLSSWQGTLLREVTGSGRVKEASIKMRNLISDVIDSPLSHYRHRKCIKVTLSMLFPGKSRPSSTRTHCEASVRRAALAIATKPHVQASKRRVGATGD